MKVPLRQETNFFALSWAPFGGMNISEGHFYLEISHPTHLIFETASSLIASSLTASSLTASSLTVVK